MQKIIRLLCVLLVFVMAGSAFAAGLADFQGLKGSLDVAGGTAHIPIMKEAAKRIMAQNPDIRISVAGGGSGVGVEQAGAGLVHIGNTGRPLKEAEISKYGLVSFAFAIDGVAVVVHPKNPVQHISAEQLAGIYKGEITNWKALGGADESITVYTREDGSGTREVFVEKALNKGGITPAANVLASNGAMKTAIAQDKRGIGYVSIGHLDAGVKALTFEGMEPTQQNALGGSYTLTRKLYMNTKGEPQGLVKAFIDYIFSPEGADIIRQSGYIPLQD